MYGPRSLIFSVGWRGIDFVDCLHCSGFRHQQLGSRWKWTALAGNTSVRLSICWLLLRSSYEIFVFTVVPVGILSFLTMVCSLAALYNMKQWYNLQDDVKWTESSVAFILHTTVKPDKLQLPIWMKIHQHPPKQVCYTTTTMFNSIDSKTSIMDRVSTRGIVFYLVPLWVLNEGAQDLWPRLQEGMSCDTTPVSDNPRFFSFWSGRTFVEISLDPPFYVQSHRPKIDLWRPFRGGAE